LRYGIATVAFGPAASGSSARVASVPAVGCRRNRPLGAQAEVEIPSVEVKSVAVADGTVGYLEEEIPWARWGRCSLCRFALGRWASGLDRCCDETMELGTEA